MNKNDCEFIDYDGGMIFKGDHLFFDGKEGLFEYCSLIGVKPSDLCLYPGKPFEFEGSIDLVEYFYDELPEDFEFEEKYKMQLKRLEKAILAVVQASLKSVKIRYNSKQFKTDKLDEDYQDYLKNQD